MHAGTDNYTYLTTAPIRRVIPTMAIPTIISMLVTALYNMADTFFVGKARHTVYGCRGRGVLDDVLRAGLRILLWARIRQLYLTRVRRAPPRQRSTHGSHWLLLLCDGWS